jgi:hypothetical protein
MNMDDLEGTVVTATVNLDEGMQEAIAIGRALMKGIGKSGITLSDSPLDLLLVGIARNYEDALAGYLNNRGMSVHNVAQVRSELYPAGDVQTGEIKQGSRIFRINHPAAGEYKFIGDELNPEHELIIMSHHIQYGREFSQICDVLERFLERDFGVPTYAFFRKIVGRNGKNFKNNIFVPVGKSPGRLPFHTDYGH